MSPMVCNEIPEALAMSFGPAIQLCVGSSRDTTSLPWQFAGNPYGPGMSNFWNEMVHIWYMNVYDVYDCIDGANIPKAFDPYEYWKT